MQAERVKKEMAAFILRVLSLVGMAIATVGNAAPAVAERGACDGMGHPACIRVSAVREQTTGKVVVRKHSALIHRFTSGNVLAVVSPTSQIGLDFNNPVAGAPLYFGDNLNWEEAPPFGRW